jgi:sulfide dehydrogenase [flavocytochrome c] flavoprotein subunit
MDNKRRELLKMAGIGAAAATVGILPTVTDLGGKAEAATLSKQVIVIGWGFGGSTVAKYLKLWGQGKIIVTHVDINASYASPILSNLVLNGQKTLTNLTFSLATAATRNGNKFIQGKATINRSTRKVIVTKPNGTTVALPYDKVVLSPGIEFNYLPSMALANGTLSDTVLPIPHAWKSGNQVANLKAQLNKMPNTNGTYVLCIPKKPYRCPPGPYERACVIADILKRVKGGGKVIIFDANTPNPLTPTDKYSAIQAETHTFTTAFTGQFAGIVEYVSNAELLEVGSTGGQFGTKYVSIKLGDGSIRDVYANVLNVLPEHKAGDIAFETGLIPSGSRFVPVNLQSYASTADPDIHVIGDSHSSGLPKAGHVANSEAKICADAIVREFGILLPHFPEEVPVTNSACYSPITNTTASWLTAGYRYNPLTGAMDRVAESFNEAEMPSGDNYKMMLAWANNLFADTFSV